MKDERCKFMVPERPHYIRSYRCSRKAVDGDYCKQHAKIIERRAAARAKI